MCRFCRRGAANTRKQSKIPRGYVRRETETLFSEALIESSASTLGYDARPINGSELGTFECAVCGGESKICLTVTYVVAQ